MPIHLNELNGLGNLGIGFFKGFNEGNARRSDLLAELEKERRKEQMKRYSELMDIVPTTVPNQFNISELEMAANQGSMPYSQREGAMSQVANFGTLGTNPNISSLPEAIKNPNEDQFEREGKLRAMLSQEGMKKAPAIGEASTPKPYATGVPKSFAKSPELTGEYVLREAERKAPGSTKRGGSSARDAKTADLFDMSVWGQSVNAYQNARGMNKAIDAVEPPQLKVMAKNRVAQAIKAGAQLSPDEINSFTTQVGAGPMFDKAGNKLAGW